MKKKFKFTNSRIRALKPHDPDSPSTELELTDDSDVTGLKLLIGKSGSKRFLLRYSLQGKKSISIGRFGEIDVTLARKIAQKYKAQIAEGIDPKAEKDSYKSMPTISEFFWNTYFPMIKTKKRAWKNDLQRFKRFIEPKLGSKRYKELKPIDVVHLQQDIANSKKMNKNYAPATNNRVIAIIKTMTSYALKLGIVENNAAAPISLLKENNIRERFFDIDESKRIINAALELDNPYFGAAIAMLYLTGNRKSEVFGLKWSNFDREARTILVEHSKSGKPYIMYLSSMAFEIINRLPTVKGNPYIFAGRIAGNHVKDVRITYRKVLVNAGITDFEGICFHTARHSVASNMISSGKFSQIHVKQQLAHESIQSSERYIKHTPSSARNISEGFSDLINQANM
ncbi:site-specific integrase [Colwellia sp. KU-HH00111]|uniref:site-specific integrase n=1 Tax=Colwellia sp. KU-HH00111 TaxID=3127652 RepID=UPI003104AB06